MTPRRFRWHRISAVLKHDPTGTVEIVVGFCFVLVPGLFLVLHRTALPGPTVWYFAHLGVEEARMGLWAIAFGLAQTWGAGTNWYTARAWIATVLAGSLTALVMAYWSSGYGERSVVPFMVGAILAEMFIAWRSWHERPDPFPVGQVGTRADVPIQ